MESLYLLGAPDASDVGGASGAVDELESVGVGSVLLEADAGVLLPDLYRAPDLVPSSASPSSDVQRWNHPYWTDNVPLIGPHRGGGGRWG